MYDPRMRIALVFALLVLPCTALADDKGPPQSALIWARDTVAERIKDPLPAEDFPADAMLFREAASPLELRPPLRTWYADSFEEEWDASFDLFVQASGHSSEEISVTVGVRGDQVVLLDPAAHLKVTLG